MLGRCRTCLGHGGRIAAEVSEPSPHVAVRGPWPSDGRLWRSWSLPQCLCCRSCGAAPYSIGGREPLCSLRMLSTCTRWCGSWCCGMQGIEDGCEGMPGRPKVSTHTARRSRYPRPVAERWRAAGHASHVSLSPVRRYPLDRPVTAVSPNRSVPPPGSRGGSMRQPRHHLLEPHPPVQTQGARATHAHAGTPARSSARQSCGGTSPWRIRTRRRGCRRTRRERSICRCQPAAVRAGHESR